ncbi:MAG: TlpA family protein disulfide reductase [Gemmatimonadota bacterium]
MRGGAVVALGGVLGGGAALRLAAFLATAPVATFASTGEVPGGTLLFAFQPGDCPSRRQLIRRWNALHESGELPVLGVGLHFPKEADRRERILRSAGIRFPVRFDVAGRVERLILRLGYARTPVSLLLDRNGRPRLAVPPGRSHGAGPAEAVRLVERYARLLGAAPGKPE